MARKIAPLPPDDTLLTPAQAASLLKITIKTMDVWRCTGKYNIPFIKVGGHIRYRRTDLENWIESRTHRAEVA